MKVLYFSRDYTTHDRRFLTKLAEASHQIWYLRLQAGSVHRERRVPPDAVQVIEWPGAHYETDGTSTVEALLQLMPDFESILDRVQPDLVHAGPLQSCGLMTAIAGFRPFLAMSLGSDILVDADRDPLWRWMTRYTLSRSDMVLCDCRAVRARIQQLLPYPDDLIVQFPWGIDLDDFAPGRDSLGLRKRLGWEGSSIVLSTRSWEPIYGLEVLLEAFRLAFIRQPTLRLVLVGDGSRAAEIQRFVVEHDLSSVIHRPGMLSNDKLAGYFKAADVYMSCAYSDGTSVSLLEAMATGLPVVVTDVPCNREWVMPTRNGWLSPAGNASAFARALLSAAALTSSQRKSVANESRAIALERANWAVNSRKLLGAYERLEALYSR